MRRHVLALLLRALLLSGCGGVRILGIINTGAPFFWNAEIVAPATTTIILSPGSPVIVIIEFVPVGNTFFTGTQFINAFNNANPNMLFCPGIVNVVNNGLFSPKPLR